MRERFSSLQGCHWTKVTTNSLMATVSSGAFRINILSRNRFQQCSRGHMKKEFGSVAKIRVDIINQERKEGT